MFVSCLGLPLSLLIFYHSLLMLFLIFCLGVSFLIPVAALIAFKELPAAMQTEKRIANYQQLIKYYFGYLIFAFMFQIFAAFCRLDDQIMLLMANSVIGFSIFVILLCFFLAIMLRKIEFLFAGLTGLGAGIAFYFFTLRFDRMLTGM